MTREDLSALIVEKIEKEKKSLSESFHKSSNKIGFFFLDDLLPSHIVDKIYSSFPNSEIMKLKKSIREFKYVSAQMDELNPLLEEIIFAFQDERVVKLIGEICGVNDLHPDEKLYAGGISMMGKNHFLNPHLDNSHDKDRSRWRILNVLFYVSPDWTIENGGNLELWPDGLNNSQITVESKFNRLVVMATHNNSLHSVSKVVVDKSRCCVSNYYFSDKPLLPSDTYHVTSFRARPNNKLTDVFLRLDTMIRGRIRKIVKKGLIKNPHYYKKK